MPVIIRQGGPGDEPPSSTSCTSSPPRTTTRPTSTSTTCGTSSPPRSAACCSPWTATQAVGLLSYATVPGLFHAADSGLIEAFVVAEGRRGEGIGRQLLQAALRLLEDAGCAEISVSTGADNEVAQKLYCDLGLDEASVLLEKHMER